MRAQTYLKIISGITFLLVFVFAGGNVSADNCLETWLPNMIANPGFEETPDYAGWSVSSDKPGTTTSIDNTITYSGNASAKVVWSGGLAQGDPYNQNYGRRTQTFNVTPGDTYRLSGYIKTEGITCDECGSSSIAGWNGVRLEVQDSINGWQTFSKASDSIYGTSDWTEVSMEFIVPAGTTQVRVYLRRMVGTQSGLAYGTGWWDDIELIPVDPDAVDNSRNWIGNPGFEETAVDGSGVLTDILDWNDPVDSGYPYGDPAGVTTTVDDTNSFTGNSSLKVTWDGSSTSQNYSHTYQIHNVIPGRTYRVDGYIKTEGIYCETASQLSWNGVRILISDPDHPYQTPGYWSSTTESLYGTNDWTKVSTQFTIPPQSSRIKIHIRRFVGPQSGFSYGTGWWDDIQLRPVPEINAITISTGVITIDGAGFGIDPGEGYRSSIENCVMYNGACIPDDSINSWSDTQIVIDDVGADGIRVKSGGIVSNVMVAQPETTLSNSTISLYFPNLYSGDGIGQITQIRDDGTEGRTFINSSIDTLPLYEFTVKETPFTDQKEILSSQDGSVLTRTLETTQNGEQLLTVTAEHCGEFIVTAKAVLPQDEGGARFSIEVDNLGNRVLQSVRYPLIAARSALDNGSDDVIVVPYAEGYLIREPYSIERLDRYKDIDHPGSMTLQMMAYYDSENPYAGLYMSTDDTEGYKKKFGFEKTYTHILFSFLHVTHEGLPNPDDLYGGNDLVMNYNVHLDIFSGDWHDAADKYKEWVIQPGVPWTSATLKQRTDVPEWLYDETTMIDCYYCSHETFDDMVNAYKSILGVDSIILYPGGHWGYSQMKGASWSGIDYFTDDPEYDDSAGMPPLYESLKFGIDELLSQGDNTLLFIEGMYWDQYYFKLSSGASCGLFSDGVSLPSDWTVIDDRADFYTHGNPNEITKEDQSIYDYMNFASEDGYCRMGSRMCIGTDTDNVMDHVIYNNIKRGIDHETKLMSLDGVISGYIAGCWNPDHGHPLGEGKWTHDRFKKVLGDIRSDIIIPRGKLGEFGLAMEVMHELYLQDLPFNYMRNSGLYSRTSSQIPIKKAPLFNYVFKEYFLSTDRGLSLGNSNSFTTRWGLAMDFTQGTVQGTMISSDIPDPAAPESVLNGDIINFYRRLIQMKKTDFYKAKILNPPRFDGLPPETTVSSWVNSASYYYIADSVLTNVFKTDDRTVSYLLVNANEDGNSGCATDACEITFPLQQTAYGLPSADANIRITKNGLKGKEVESFQIASLDNEAVVIHIDGGEVVDVTVKSGCMDMDGDGYFVEGGECGPEDCDDNDPAVSPGTGTCGVVVDCTDEPLEAYYRDADEDMYGDASVIISACIQPAGYVYDATDCDDSDYLVNPAIIETPYNGLNDDCNPSTKDDDLDGDGFGIAEDCDDNNVSVYNNAVEICDGLDNDCDGFIDEDLTRATTCGVGVCTGNTGEETCSAGTWGNDTCEPLAGATVEVCDDGLDNDCDGFIDSGISITLYQTLRGNPIDLASITATGSISNLEYIVREGGAACEVDPDSCDLLFAGNGSYVNTVKWTSGEKYLQVTGDDAICNTGLISASGVFTFLHDADLVVYYPLNEGSGGTVNDVSDHGNNATVTGAPQWVSGKAGSHALEFNGVNDFLSVYDVPLWDDSGFTLSAWVKPYGTQDTYAPIVYKWTAGIRFGWGNKIQFIVYNANNEFTSLSSSTGLPDGEWSLLTAVYNAADDTMRIYINGELNASLPNSGGLRASNFDGTISFTDIGGTNNDPERMFNGILDEIRIYSRALGADEINNLFPCNDNDGDGYSIDGGMCGDVDCDDNNASINPGVNEICDGIDNNCDGSTDEGLTRATTCGVGECSGNTGEETCTAGVWGNDTCDPLAGATTEVCNQLDDNCDGSVDEGFAIDTDSDGILDDGDGSCIAGDNLCMDGNTANCDDNCWTVYNPGQINNEYFDLKKAKVIWIDDPGGLAKVKVSGELALSCGDYYNLNPVGSAKIGISGVPELVNESVSFTVNGSEGRKWKYVDDTQTAGINKFKIDWNGAKFKYDQDIRIESVHIGYETATIEIDRKTVTDAVSVEVNGVTVSIDEAGEVAVLPSTIEFDVDDDGEIEVDLPFTLAQNMVFTVNQGVDPNVNTYTLLVGDYYIFAVGKYKVNAWFDQGTLNGDSTPATLDLEMTVGDHGFVKTYQITDTEWKHLTTQKWKYKELK